MNSNKGYVCIGCGSRVAANERRPVAGKCIRLFVATRLFPTYLPTDVYFCTKCRSMFNKWKALPEFRDALTTMDQCDQTASTVNDDITDEAETNDECMDDENDSDQPVDDMSSEEDSMDNDPSGDHTVDASSSDDQSITDLAVGEEPTEDEEMNLDENSEAVSFILYLSDFFILIFRHV